MPQKMMKRIYSSKGSPGHASDATSNLTSTEYFTITSSILNHFSSRIGRLKSYLTTPQSFDPYFDPYSCPDSLIDACSKGVQTPYPNSVSIFFGKWECTQFKTGLIHVVATIYHYFFSNSSLEDDILMISTMNRLVVKEKNARRTTHVSDLICFNMDIQEREERQEDKLRNVTEHIHSRTEANKRKLKRHPSIQYDSCFLDEKWNLVDILDQKNDVDWDVIGTYQVKPVVSELIYNH